MSSLRQVAPKTKTYQTTDPDSSRYLARMKNVLMEVDDGYDEGDRMDKALAFFHEEWVRRDQTFLRKFPKWAERVDTPEIADLEDLAKFGSAKGRSVSMATIANNLQIPFEDAMFRVLALAALGLVERDWSREKNGKPSYWVKFSRTAEIEFMLGALSTKHYNENEAALLARFFEPEIKLGRAKWALRVVRAAVRAFQHNHGGAPGVEIEECFLPVAKMLRDVAPMAIRAVAQKAGLPTGLATYVVLALVASGYDIRRGEPFNTRHHGGTALLNVTNVVNGMNDVPFDTDEQNRQIEIGDLSPDHARTLFAVAQSQATAIMDDPAIPGPSLDDDDDVDDLEEIFGGIEGPDFEAIDNEHVLEGMQALEERLHNAEVLAEDVEEMKGQLDLLKTEVTAKIDSVVKALGLQVEEEDPDEGYTDDEEFDSELQDQVHELQSQISVLEGQLAHMRERVKHTERHSRENAALACAAYVKNEGALYMPNSRKSNKKSRAEAARTISNLMLKEMGIDPPVDDDDLAS